MFFGRKNEMKELNRRYENGEFEFAVIYGRRRVGKTSLINAFVGDKPAVFYTGIQGNAHENLEELSRCIYAFQTGASHASVSFENFKSALEAVFAMAKTRRVIFVIDEFPYLAGSQKSISSLLQNLIDRYKDTSKLFLILCGSSLSFMERQVLGAKSPLYGRRTCQFKISPFSFFEAREFFPVSNPADFATIYGVTGGIPLYLSLMSKIPGLRENIIANFLTPSSYLFEEPLNLIKQECRDPAQFNSIIRAIAAGATKLSEIAAKAGLGTAHAAGNLRKLISIGVIEKENPFGDSTGRRAIYRLSDSMFSFWYRFIPDHYTAISRGFGNAIYEAVEGQLSDYMGRVFEDICRQYLWKLRESDRVRTKFLDLGRWWGNDPRKKEEAEIDLMGAADKKSGLFAECKWTKEFVSESVLDLLVERSALFSYSNVEYYLFARTGFTKACVKKAKAMGNVTLVTLTDMVL